MAVESVTYIDDFVATNPVGNTDAVSTLDNHIRNIKTGLLNTFPNITGAMTATQAELNNLDGYTGNTNDLNILSGGAAAGVTAAEFQYLNGVTSAIQTQLDAKLVAASNLSDVANAGTARTNLGVAIGSDVQAYDAQLADVAGLAVTDGNFIVGNGSNFVAESGATARASLGLDAMALEPDVSEDNLDWANLTGVSQTILQWDEIKTSGTLTTTWVDHPGLTIADFILNVPANASTLNYAWRGTEASGGADGNVRVNHSAHNGTSASHSGGTTVTTSSTGTVDVADESGVVTFTIQARASAGTTVVNMHSLTLWFS